MKTHVLHVDKVVQYYFRVTWFYVTSDVMSDKVIYQLRNFFLANITSTRVKLASKFDGTEIIVRFVSKNSGQYLLVYGPYYGPWPYQFFGVKDSQDSTRHNYTMIPKRAENFAKNITTRIRFGKENHLDEFATNCNITSSGTLPVTIWERILSVWSRPD